MIKEKNPLISFLEGFGRPHSTGVNTIHRHQAVKIFDFPLLRVYHMQDPVTEKQPLRPSRIAGKIILAKHYRTSCDEIFPQNVFQRELGTPTHHFPIVPYMFIRQQFIVPQYGRPPKTSRKIWIVPQKISLFLQLMRINPIIVCFTKRNIFPFRFGKNKRYCNSLPC